MLFFFLAMNVAARTRVGESVEYIFTAFVPILPRPVVGSVYINTFFANGKRLKSLLQL